MRQVYFEKLVYTAREQSIIDDQSQRGFPFIINGDRFESIVKGKYEIHHQKEMHQNGVRNILILDVDDDVNEQWLKEYIDNRLYRLFYKSP